MENESLARDQPRATTVPIQESGLEQASQQQPHHPEVQSVQQDMDFATYQMQQYGGNQFDTSPLDMRNVANALPDYSYRPYQQTQYQPQLPQSAASNATPIYAYQNQQFAGQAVGNYYVPFTQQMPHQTYAQQRTYPNFPVNAPGAASQQQFSPHTFFPPQQLMQTPVTAQNLQYAQFHQQQPNSAQMPASSYPPRVGATYPVPQLRIDSYSEKRPDMSLYPQPESSTLRRNSSNSSLHASSTLRGPPRKPKQSGHALWVGNLPPGTHIVDLKDHFSRDATDDIESVFLISKSNCAFVNYKSESSCAAAMNRFHDSRFQGVRLICRLRRGSAPGSNSVSTATPTGPNPGTLVSVTGEEKANLPNGTPDNCASDKQVSPGKEVAENKVKERYFIVKSLTIEDLERSVHSGIWATQSHNEVALNRAFQTAENVYLIFSANKSGEYFGYARMDSAIDDEGVATVDIPLPEPKPVPTSSPTAADLPLTILTPATATAPKGRIIDDSARGTIFWEVELELLTPRSPGDSGEVSGEEPVSATSPKSRSPLTQQTTFGKPFKITWMSTERLPFYRTRGLRNPWNTNREVKIARDGTELEPGVGRKLVGMFGQAQFGLPKGPMQQQPAFAQQQQQPKYPGMGQGGYGYGYPAQSQPYGRSY